MKKEHEFYKICWRVPSLMGLYGVWTKIEPARYATKEEAYEAMTKLGEKLCKELAKTYMTKLDVYSYKMIEPTRIECTAPIVYRGVLISENTVSFESTPVGYLQVFEV